MKSEREQATIESIKKKQYILYSYSPSKMFEVLDIYNEKGLVRIREISFFNFYDTSKWVEVELLFYPTFKDWLRYSPKEFIYIPILLVIGFIIGIIGLILLFWNLVF